MADPGPEAPLEGVSGEMTRTVAALGLAAGGSEGGLDGIGQG
jgi:hypothetical protein